VEARLPACPENERAVREKERDRRGQLLRPFRGLFYTRKNSLLLPKNKNCFYHSPEVALVKGRKHAHTVLKRGLALPALCLLCLLSAASTVCSLEPHFSPTLFPFTVRSVECNRLGDWDWIRLLLWRIIIAHFLLRGEPFSSNWNIIRLKQTKNNLYKTNNLFVKP